LSGKIACDLRSRPFLRSACGFSLDDEELATRRIALLAVSELARKSAGIHCGFAARQFASLAAASRARAASMHFAMMRRATVECLSNHSPSRSLNKLLDVALDVAVELAFGLAFKLRLRQANADDGDETFANVITADRHFVFLFFQHAGRGSEGVDGARQRRAEAGKVRAAVDGVDRIGEGEDVFPVTVVVIAARFDFDVAALAFDINRRIVERSFAAIEMFLRIR